MGTVKSGNKDESTVLEVESDNEEQPTHKRVHSVSIRNGDIYLTEIV